MEDPTTYMTQRRRLANELRRLRERSGTSGYDLADKLTWSQSKVSKIENARLSVKPAEAVAAARALGATPEEIARVEELVQAAEAEHVSIRQIHQRGDDLGTKQRQFHELAKTARSFRIFSPQIPGLLQLPDYARLVFARGGSSEEEIAAAVNARLARQQMLFDSSRRFEFVLVEQSIRWRSMPLDMHLAQLDRISAISTAANIRVGIVLWTTYAPVWHGHAFTIMQDRSDDEERLVSLRGPRRRAAHLREQQP